MQGREKLLRHLKESSRVFFREALERAFNVIDRADFVPQKFRDEAYEDYPLTIGFGQTISQPTTVAFMLEKLDVKTGQHVLDVGSGSGWTTALLAELVGENGRVWGVELIPELVRFGQKNLARYRFRNTHITFAESVVGLPTHAPFDRILVSAAAGELPKKLVEQLKVGGTMVIPIRNSIVTVKKIEEDKIETQEYPGFVFVPLRRYDDHVREKPSPTL